MNLGEAEISLGGDLDRAAQALKARDLRTAEAIVRTILKTRPNDVRALQLLGEIAALAGLLHEAEALHRRALSLGADFELARLHLANVLNDQGRPGEALAELKRIDTRIRELEGFRRLYADLLSQIGEFDEAIDIYRQIVGSDPKNLDAWSRLVFLLSTVGKSHEAVDACRSALAISPISGRPWAMLASLKTYRFTAADIEALEGALADRRPSSEDRLQLHFALGKALEDHENFHSSFDHYRRGNELRKARIRYAPEWGGVLLERLRSVFTREFMQSHAEKGDPTPDPIFIVGMPRSGSTLVEQILASHPMIEGTGELPDIHALAISLDADPRLGPRNIRYLDRLAALSDAQLCELGRLYLERTRIQRKTRRPFFVDKMPSNWAHVGFIKLILPNAKIIDVRRHPLACGFSNYKQLFGRGQEFSYDLAHIGAYYRDYSAAMEHFDQVAPSAIHRLIYERLVSDPEKEIRLLLDFISVPFDRSCVRFHETKRPVRTPSSEQVRQPLRADFVDRWKVFEAELDPLKKALGPALEHWDDPQQR